MVGEEKATGQEKEKPKQTGLGALVAIGIAAAAVTGAATGSKTAAVVAGLGVPGLLRLIESRSLEEYEEWENRYYAQAQGAQVAAQGTAAKA